MELQYGMSFSKLESILNLVNFSSQKVLRARYYLEIYKEYFTIADFPVTCCHAMFSSLAPGRCSCNLGLIKKKSNWYQGYICMCIYIYMYIYIYLCVCVYLQHSLWTYPQLNLTWDKVPYQNTCWRLHIMRIALRMLMSSNFNLCSIISSMMARINRTVRNVSWC